MNHFIAVFLIIWLSTVVTGCANKNMAKPIECKDPDSARCILEGISPRFIPVSNDPSAVIEVAVQWSKVPLVNDTLCQTFPNTEKLNLGGQYVEGIVESAFHLCINLRHLFLGGNQIKKLAPGTFKENKLLSHLWLYMNELRHLEPDVFVNNVFLEHLYLSSNKLHSFSLEVFKPLRNMKILTLHHNRLKDLDVFALLNSMPLLIEVQIRFNQFECEKLKYILRAFQTRNVYMGMNGGEPDKYMYEYYKNTECIRKIIRTRAPLHIDHHGNGTLTKGTKIPKDLL